MLKPGGRLAFYDSLAANGRPEPLYPVPWAQDAATSTLLTAEETAAVLAEAAFDVAPLDDVTQAAIGWAQAQGTPAQPGTANPGMIVGARMAGMAQNFVRNLGEGRVRLITGIVTAI